MKRPIEREPIKVRTNFFEVTKLPKTKITHYDVTISPVVPPRLNRKVFACFSEENKRILGGVKPVYDGKANMFTHIPLPFEAAINAPVAKLRPPEIFKIVIRKARDINMEDLFQFLNAKGNMTNNCKMAINAMNIIISHEVSAKYPTLRNLYYTSHGSRSLGEGIEAWQGYYQSAHPTRGKMMINIDLRATAFYEGGPLIQMVARILGRRSPNDLCSGLSDMERQKVEKRLKKLRISDNCKPEIRRKFKIVKLTQTSASNTMFDGDNGNKIDVKTYFQNKYNRSLLYPFLPCVVVRKNNYLPIEFCNVIPEQRYMRKLNEIQTANMIKFTHQPPSARANNILAGLDVLNYRNNVYLRQFGMEISNNMAVVNARILPTPTIQYHQSSRKNRVQPNGGSWNLRDKKVINGATLSSWSMNVKLGGENSFLIPEHIQFLADEPTILMGAGVTHPWSGDNEGLSYAALCGSVNVKASHYAASIRVQLGHTEIITNLANMVKELLKTFYQTCGLKPKKIIFYRDSVSKSQFKFLLKSELTAIKAACQSLEANYRPTITFVVIQKRHHTRFFPMERKYADRSGNCLPGTVVDMDITHPFEFDF
ncbi:hypothetical protein RhiirA4_519173, partial [Rhizophagus irregularis]